jgi:hypothetical protein
MVVHVLHHRNLLLETDVLARNEMTTTYTGCFAIDSGSGPKCTIVTDRLYGMGVENSGSVVRTMALHIMQLTNRFVESVYKCQSNMCQLPSV